MSYPPGPALMQGNQWGHYPVGGQSSPYQTGAAMHADDMGTHYKPPYSPQISVPAELSVGDETAVHEIGSNVSPVEPQTSTPGTRVEQNRK
jgi:hypothetical protein